MSDRDDERDDANERELARSYEDGNLVALHVVLDGPPGAGLLHLADAACRDLLPRLDGAEVVVGDRRYRVAGLGISPAQPEQPAPDLD